MDELFGQLRAWMQAGPVKDVKGWMALLRQAYHTNSEQYDEVWLGYLEGFVLPEVEVETWEGWCAVEPFFPLNAPISLNLSYSALDEVTVPAFVASRRLTCVRALSVTLHGLRAELLDQVLNAPGLDRLELFEVIHSDVTLAHMNVLAQASALARLKVLYLPYNDLESELLEVLWQSPMMEHLESLSLDGNNLDDRSLEQLSRLTMPKLKALSIGALGVTDVGGRALLASPWCARLESLNASDNTWSDAFVEALLSYPWRALRDVVLYETPISEAALMGLLNGPARLTLRSLKLEHVDMEGVVKMCRGASLPALESLHFGDSSLTEDAMVALGETSALPALRSLTFSSCALNAQTFRLLCMSPLCAQLTMLSLRYNALGESFAECVPLVGASWTSLTRLRLDCCEIGEAGARALAALPGALSGLRELELYENSIGDDGLIALVETGQLKSLTFLDVSINGLTDRSALALASASMPHLETLSLCANEIGEEGAESLSVSSTLRAGAEIDMSENACAAWDLEVGNAQMYFDSWE